MPTPDRKTPAWLVEQLAHDELDATVAAALRARLEAEGRAPDAVCAALRRSDQETLAALAPATVAAEVRRRMTRALPAGTRRQPVLLGAVVAAAGALAIVVAVRQVAVRQQAGPTQSGVVAPEPTTIKGTRPPAGVQLFVYRHTRDGDGRLTDGARAASGDLLQLAYRATDPGFGVLLSIDGAGTVTQHWPDPGVAQAPALRVGGELRLSSAYELDDAPAFERFFLVRADRTFAVAPVLAAARTLASGVPGAHHAPLPLPASFTQISLVLEKTR